MGIKCALNWTSFFRKDDARVPAVEKFKGETWDATSPKTLEELQSFGDEHLETGDCLIMHCTHRFGKIAQLMTGSPWDHVAMVVRCPTDDEHAMQARIALIQKAPQPISATMPWPKPGELGPVEVFEAMGGGAFSYPFTAHAICRGRFCKYTAVRRLRNAKGEPLDGEAKQKIEEFVQSYWGRPYEEGRAGMFELARPIFKRNPRVHKKRDKSQETLDNLFCSELIAEAYQAAGILPEETLNSNEILPSMFAPGKAVDKYLKVQSHGYTLGEVEIFKAPKSHIHTAILDRRAELKSKLVQEGHDEENLMKPN